jgi:hypothetical protein
MPAASLRVLPRVKARQANSPAVRGPSIPRALHLAVTREQAALLVQAVVPASAHVPASAALHAQAVSAAHAQASVALPAQHHLPVKRRVPNEPAMREAVADVSSIRKLKRAP